MDVRISDSISATVGRHSMLNTNITRVGVECMDNRQNEDFEHYQLGEENGGQNDLRNFGGLAENLDVRTVRRRLAGREGMSIEFYIRKFVVFE